MKKPSLITLMFTAAALVGACGDSGTDEGGDAGARANWGDIPCGDVGPIFAGDKATGKEDKVTIEVIGTDPAPPKKYESDWVIEVQDGAGEPLEEAELAEVLPFMPTHGHDGQTTPVIYALDEPGRFGVDQVNMWMGGPWQLRVTVEDPGGDDLVIFDVCIPK